MNPTFCRTFSALTTALLVASTSFAQELIPAEVAAQAQQQQQLQAAVAVDQSTTLPEDPVSAPDDLPPHGDKLRMADVCQLIVEQGRLVLHTRMPTNHQVQTLEVPVEGLRGSNTIRIERDEEADGSTMDPAFAASSEPSLFYLVNNDTEQPDASLVQTQISLTGGQLLIHQHVQTRDGWRVISLSQGGDSNGDFTGPSALTLTLTVTRGSAPDRRVHCAAPDWLTFRRCYPREVNLYLRPLLRTMRQDGVFAIDSAVAWQVFHDEWAVDANVGRRITALLPKFDSDDFNVRNGAWKALCGEGVVGALYLIKFDASKLSAEQASRVEAFLARFPLLEEDEVAQCRTDPNFMLDCLYGSEDDVRNSALRRLATLMHAEIAAVPAGTEEDQQSRIDQWRQEISMPSTAQAASR